MSTLLFRLRHVPDDEADDVRRLLDDAGIDWYETTAGNWGVSLPGIWLTNDDDLDRARTLLQHYQEQRASQSRQAYRQRISDGAVQGIGSRLLQRPVATLGIVLFCLFILYVSLKPVWQMIQFQP